MLRDENGRFIKGNEGFWKGKKRPNLVLPQFFAKGITPWNKDTTGLMPEPWNKGKPMDEETRQKVSLARSGIRSSVQTEFKKGQFQDDKHPLWKGDKVGYHGLHLWLARKLGKPLQCSNCEKAGGSPRGYHWHNISGKYRRDLIDWIRLCAKCHRQQHGNQKQRLKATTNRNFV